MTIGDRLKVMTSEQLWRWAVAALFDSTVNPIDALGTGLVVKTGVGPPSTYAARTITGTSLIVDVVNGNGVSGNPTISLDQNLLSGWTRTAAITSCASATLVNITGADTFLSKGDKLHLHDTFGADTYHYVIATSSTQATVAGDNAPAGSLSYGEYSKAASPFGFPAYFNFNGTPVLGYSANPANPVNFFSLHGTRCFVTHRDTANGTSDSTSLQIPLPITAGGPSNGLWLSGGNQGTDNSAYQNNVLVTIFSTDTKAICQPQGGAVNWTNSGPKSVNYTIGYDI